MSEDLFVFVSFALTVVIGSKIRRLIETNRYHKLLFEVIGKEHSAKLFDLKSEVNTNKFFAIIDIVVFSVLIVVFAYKSGVL